MPLSREEIEQIAKSSAQTVLEGLHRYAVEYEEPSTIPNGLRSSMIEETTATEWYRRRALNAEKHADLTTYALYKHIAEEENKHYGEFHARLQQVGGGEGSPSGSVAKSELDKETCADLREVAFTIYDIQSVLAGGSETGLESEVSLLKGKAEKLAKAGVLDEITINKILPKYIEAVEKKDGYLAHFYSRMIFKENIDILRKGCCERDEAKKLVAEEATKGSNPGLPTKPHSIGNPMAPTKEVLKLEVRIPLELLWKDEKNYLDKLTQRIKEFGITEPITIRIREDGSMIVWDGLHRLAVAEKLGIEQIPVIYIRR